MQRTVSDKSKIEQATLESESEAKLEATLQQQQMMQRSGHQLEETLQQEKMQQTRMLQEGRMLEETLQQNQLQQSQHQGRLQDQSLLLHSQLAADTKNQQLEAQLARIQQEKVESNMILSKQNEKMKNLGELGKSMCEPSSTIVKTKSPENGTAERQSSPEFRNLAGGNPTQPENQTFIPNQFKELEASWHEDQPPQP